MFCGEVGKGRAARSAITKGSNRRKRRGTVKRKETMKFGLASLPEAHRERLRSRRNSVSLRLSAFKRRMTVTQTAAAVDALSRGYRTIVPIECVADKHESYHFANLTDLSLKYADVVRAHEVFDWLETYRPAQGGP